MIEKYEKQMTAIAHDRGYESAEAMMTDLHEKQNLPACKIRDMLKIDHKPITYYRRKLNFTPKPAGNKIGNVIHELNQEEVFEYWVTHTDQQAAKYFGCSIFTVVENVKKHLGSDHVDKLLWRAERRASELGYENAEKMLSFYRNKKNFLSQKDIAKKIGLPCRVVMHCLKIYDLNGLNKERCGVYKRSVFKEKDVIEFLKTHSMQEAAHHFMCDHGRIVRLVKNLSEKQIEEIRTERSRETESRFSAMDRILFGRNEIVYKFDEKRFHADMRAGCVKAACNYCTGLNFEKCTDQCKKCKYVDIACRAIENSFNLETYEEIYHDQEYCSDLEAEFDI